MIKRVLFLSSVIVLSSCSGSDDNSHSTNPPTSSLIGRWVITKAIHDTSTDTIYYSHDGNCGKEVLEFHSDRTVEETIYVDSNCQNGVGSEFDWWTSGNGFKMGYQNSDTSKLLKIANGQLYFDGWEDWGVRKYYVKVD